MISTKQFLFLVELIVFPSLIRGNVNLVPSLPMGIPNSGNSDCQAASNTYVTSLQNLTYWAQKMWDSTSKSVTALIDGNSYQFGDFDECLHTKAPFPVKYCLVTIIANFSAASRSSELVKQLYFPTKRYHEIRNPYHLGWCVADVCSNFHLEKSMNFVIQKKEYLLSQYNVSFSAHVEESACHTVEDVQGKWINESTILFCALTIFILLLVLLSTLCDTHAKRESLCSGTLDLIRIFSLKKNFCALLKRQHVHEGNPFLEIITGLRPACILIIVAGHRAGTTISAPMQNFSYYEEISSRTSTWLFFDGDLYVDTFFLISGILLSYNILKKLDLGQLNVFQVIFFRYIRFFPVHAYVVFFYIAILPLIGSGPIWKTIIGVEAKDCSVSWWSNLLYINNYVNVENLCIIQTWYLQVDFQLFVLSSIILFAVHSRKDSVAIAIFTVLLFLAILIPIIVVAVYGYNGYVNLFTLEGTVQPKLNVNFQNVHIKTHMRGASYIIGVITGYWLYRNHGKMEILSKSQTRRYLTTSIFLLLLAITSATLFQTSTYHYNRFSEAFHGSLRRVLWTLGTVLFLYSVAYGSGKVSTAVTMRRILSAHVWAPLTRLSYAMFMTHLVFSLKEFGELRQGRIFSWYYMLVSIMSDYLLALVTGFVIYLAIEAPVQNVIALYLKKCSKQSELDNVRNLNNKDELSR